MNAMRDTAEIAPRVMHGQPRVASHAGSVRSEILKGPGRSVLVLWGAMVCVLALVPPLVTRPERQRTMEATAQMEQFVRQLSRMPEVAPDTAGRIAKIIQRPEYDCLRLACSAKVAQRNRIARAKLQDLFNVSTMTARRRPRHPGPARAVGKWPG